MSVIHSLGIKTVRSRRRNILIALAAAWLCGCAATAPRTDVQEASGEVAPVSATTPRRLNNLVSELLNLSQPVAHTRAEWSFNNPRDGWVLLRSTVNVKAGGKASIWLEPSPATSASLRLLHESTGAATQESMQYLPAGRYTVRIQTKGPAKLDRLIVRAIPELAFCKFQYDPLISALGRYDWAFVQKHVATNVNCIVGNGTAEHGEFVKSWKQQGKRWIVECGVPALDIKQPLTADEAYTYWTQNAGFTNRLLDGVIADEFLNNRKGMKYPEWTEAVRRIRAAETFRGKMFYPYCTAIYRDPVSAEFLRTVMQAGYPFAWEVYLPEPPDEAAAQRNLETKLAAEMRRWRTALTNCEQHMVMCFGYMSLPTTETLNMNPAVDFKVWMDMQFQHLATDPAFDGLYGLMEYTCGYADEETVRWAARLYRHYGIEGNTTALSPMLGFRYRPDHIENADFADDTKGWTVEPAEPGSVEAKSLWGYSWLEGRYPKTTLGNTFIWTQRKAGKPNTFSQAIKNLQPGRLYSLKMVTADYGELQQGKSVEQKHAVSIALDGVTLLPKRSIQQAVASNYAHQLGAFKEQNPAWMNYHFRVFRANGPTAKLAISDWANPEAPSGPIGQELMFNFIELQPYFEE
jgi:hypothetical protein